jgi:hypothetical protein
MSNLWEHLTEPSTRDALNIVSNLRKGVPPDEGVLQFSIGREELLEYFERVLHEIAEYDQQGVKFIQADYGHGKTHFLDMLSMLALKHNFVVSFVVLDREKAPFNKLERVIPLIMQGIKTPAASKNGLSRILNQWADIVKGQNTNTILRRIDENERLHLLFPDFRLKLAEYALARNRSTDPAFEECLNIEKWFRGEESKSRTFRNVPDYLAAFVQFVRHLGYSGFVVMLDEAESITMLSRISNRDQANENLRQIIDNQDLHGFYFVFASTPSFLSGEDGRGAQAYQALWRRISDPLGQIQQRAFDKIIVDLPALTAEQFTLLGRRIKHIYEIAYKQQMPRVTDEHLQALAQYVKKRSDKSVRTLVRSTVMLLDEASRVEELNVLSSYELIVERVLDDEQRKRAE